MADRETAGLKETDKRIIETVFKVPVLGEEPDARRGAAKACASWHEHLGVYILESGEGGEAGWEPFSPTRDIGLALQALYALVRKGWRYDLRVTSARAVLYLFDGSREFEGVAPLRNGNLTAALPIAISRGVARALDGPASGAARGPSARARAAPASLPGPTAAL